MQAIGGLVRDCLEAFDSVLSSRIGHERKADESLALAKINDEQGKFKVWSGNIGAHRKGTSSLDYRLRDASNLRQEVQNLLEDLLEALADAKRIFDGEVQPWDEDEPVGFLPDDHDDQQGSEKDGFDFETELEQLIADIDETINYLYKVSAGLRSTPQHDRLMSSLAINTSFYEDFDIQHVRNKHPNIEPSIAQRLGKAISMRRHYFKYRESHRGKLGNGLEAGDKAADGKSTIASSLPDGLKKAELVFGTVDVDDGSESGFTQTSFATSVADSTKLRIPPLPKEAATQEYFECPLCFMILSAKSRRAWKRHVYSDLRPYVCLYEDCPTPSQVFARRRHWVEHLRRQHWRIWKCPFENSDPFQSPEAFLAHLRHNHDEAISPDQIETFLIACERPCLDFEQQHCQFCNENLLSTHQYQRHIGHHLEQLALFALPANCDTEGAEDSAAIDDANDDAGISDVSDTDEEEDDDAEGKEKEQAQDRPEADPDASSNLTLSGLMESYNKIREKLEAYPESNISDNDEIYEHPPVIFDRRPVETPTLPLVSQDDPEIQHEPSTKNEPALVRNFHDTPTSDVVENRFEDGRELNLPVEDYVLEQAQRELAESQRRDNEAHELVERYKKDEAERALREKEEAEEREREYKRKMQEQLRKSGLGEKEVKEILAGKKIEKAHDTTGETGSQDDEHERPVYTKMHRRHLSLETLRVYNVDYQLDQDPDYVLIKRWVPEPEQDVLWRHTRIIREARSMKKVQQGHVGHEPEIQWVRKKQRGRSRSPSLLAYLAGSKPA
ncbi:hypothetical protein PG993_013303 [Apiospora rasikravindrae]|uniref:C2H2-type domain-containing protein n=1 Tax=Apiospora rasikravindrae TaxID=990691 RepID=A0ABR1RYU8_9PEZI